MAAVLGSRGNVCQLLVLQKLQVFCCLLYFLACFSLPTSCCDVIAYVIQQSPELHLVPEFLANEQSVFCVALLCVKQPCIKGCLNMSVPGICCKVLAPNFDFWSIFAVLKWYETKKRPSIFRSSILSLGEMPWRTLGPFFFFLA